MGWPKGKKRGPASRELIERRLAWRKDKVLVPRNDAAMLALLRKRHELASEILSERERVRATLGPSTCSLMLMHTFDTSPYIASRAWEIAEIDDLEAAWLNGQDVSLAKLSQQ